MAQPAQHIPFPEPGVAGRVRDLRDSPTEHLWIWMRRLQASITVRSDHQVRDSRVVHRRLVAGEDATQLADDVADRCAMLDESLDMLDDILMELDRRFGPPGPGGALADQ
jgi:hypothetical protein